MQYVFDTKNTVRYRFPTHVNELVMDRQEAATSEVFIVVLEPGESPPLHQHIDTEQIFYILSGQGRLEIGTKLDSYRVEKNDIVRIPPSTLHRICCVGNVPLRYIAIDCFIAGRPEKEPSWDAHVQVVCQQQGWCFDDIKRPNG